MKLRPSLLAISFISMVAALILYFLFSWIPWLTITGICLISVSVALSFYCLCRKRGPFEISMFGLGCISLSIVIACFLSAEVRIRMDNIVTASLLSKWDWIALIVAVISLIFAACTWTSQDKTRKNTMRITPEIQFEIFKDIFRDTYRMLEVVIALEEKMKGRYNTHYPSEYHFLKLQYSENAIYPEAFVNNDSNCSLIKNLEINYRNANIEIRIVTKHICSRDMHPQIKEQDFIRLKKRIDYTLRRTRDVMKEVWGLTDTELADKIRDYVIEKAANRHDEERKQWLLNAELALKSEADYYYSADKENFIGILFPGQTDSDEAKSFLRKFNKNIYYMIHSDAICIIPFDNSLPLD